MKRFFTTAVLLLLISTLGFSTANYVYHEQTTNLTGGSCGNYMSKASAITPSDAVIIKFKVEYQNFTNSLKVYYTTNGSAPQVTGSMNSKAAGAGTTELSASYTCTFSSGGVVDVCTATIPAQALNTTVKYIIVAWHSGGGTDIYANSGTNTDPAAATVFSYTVDTPLPVSIVDILGEKKDGINNLYWKSSSEINSSYFNIQRSTNNQAWQTIGSVKATNNPSGAQYNFTDEAPLSNINYYRLQMVDNEGKVTYSKVVSVSGNDAKKSLAVYPNPVKAELNVVTDGQATGVSIFDMTGKSVLQFNDNRTKVNVQDLPNGVYFMRLLDKNGLLGEPVRFVKQ